MFSKETKYNLKVGNFSTLSMPKTFSCEVKSDFQSPGLRKSIPDEIPFLNLSPGQVL